jgi:hypothetical protein
MKTEKWVNTTNAVEKKTNPFQASEVNNNEACCGRTYKEQSNSAPVNFAALQSILDKRNELLGTVKPHQLF